MDEITAIRELVADPPPPGPQVMVRARGLLDRRIRRRAVFPGGSLARPVTIGAVAFGAAAALAAMILIPGGTRTSPAPHDPGLAAIMPRLPARPFLLAAATRAEQQRTGRFFCIDMVQGQREMVGSGDTLLPSPWTTGPDHISAAAPTGFRYALLRRDGAADCTKGSDNAWHATSDQYLGQRPQSRADAIAWRRDGSPDHWRAGHRILSAHEGPVSRSTFSKPGPGPFGGENELSLPVSPVKLLAFLLAHPLPGLHGRNQVLAEGALEVMSDPVRPAVRAAALRVLAAVPGVFMRPGVTDPEGQTGTAVWQESWVGGSPRYEATFVIIDPQTGNLLASEGIARTPVAAAAPGTVLYYTAYVNQQWTSQLPAGLRTT